MLIVLGKTEKHISRCAAHALYSTVVSTPYSKTTMGFQIKGKVAVVTGAASGLGFGYAKELLRNELKAVTIVDIDDKLGKIALEEIETEFGPGRAIYINADVCSDSKFEEVFQKTVANFGNVDILINNAGILNDSTWEEEVAVNINGTIRGILLGLENYIPKYKSGEEGLIVNIASVAGLMISPFVPIYTGTKTAVLGISRCFGDAEIYDRTKVRVITVCPGVTDTPLIRESVNRTLGPTYRSMMEKRFNLPSQEPKHATTGMVKVIKQAESGTVWVVEGGEEPYEIEFPERTGTRKQQ